MSLRPTLLALPLLLLACGGRDLPALQPSSLLAPLNAAHAHNDYLHQQPLLDALGHGFMSVEADVYVLPLLGDTLYVAHDPQDIRPARTLTALYLEPLRQRVDTLGQVQPGQDRPVQLLIDFKTEAESTWNALAQALEPYADILTVYQDGQISPGLVTVVISGNRPTDTLAATARRLAFIDGRLSDLASPPDVNLVPLISDNWAQHFSWDGNGTMPHEERNALQKIMHSAKAGGYRIRFWNTPDEPGPARDALWQVLYDLGVDHINTDDLAGLEAFLRRQQERN